jgi:hypothetical protein
MEVTDTFDLLMRNNSANEISVSSDYATSRHVSLHPTMLTNNKLEDDLTLYSSNNITANNNAGAPASMLRKLPR